MNNRELIVKLLEMVKANEWQTHHAAENTYCPYCNTDDEFWDDQKEHHAGCQYIAVVEAAESYLSTATQPM